LPNAIEAFERLTDSIAEKQVVVALDYDGTLTPIVNRPDMAVLSDEMRTVLRRVADRCPTLVISGRELRNVQQMVGVENIVYAGSHGFDITGPGGKSFKIEAGERFVPAIKRAAEELKRRLDGVEGTLIEDKRYAIAVHYRNVSEQQVDTVEQAVDAALARETELRKMGGKKVFELRPDIDWDKGTALLRILAELDLDNAEVTPFYVGDDVTDEDAFRALRQRGIGIRVGEEAGATEASYQLADPEEVRCFLERLGEWLDRRQQ